MDILDYSNSFLRQRRALAQTGILTEQDVNSLPAIRQFVENDLIYNLSELGLDSYIYNRQRYINEYGIDYLRSFHLNERVQTIIINDLTEGLQNIAGFETYQYRLNQYRQHGMLVIEPETHLAQENRQLERYLNQPLSQAITNMMSQKRFVSVSYLMGHANAYIQAVDTINSQRVDGWTENQAQQAMRANADQAILSGLFNLPTEEMVNAVYQLNEGGYHPNLATRGSRVIDQFRNPQMAVHQLCEADLLRDIATGMPHTYKRKKAALNASNIFTSDEVDALPMIREHMENRLINRLRESGPDGFIYDQERCVRDYGMEGLADFHRDQRFINQLEMQTADKLLTSGVDSYKWLRDSIVKHHLLNSPAQVNQLPAVRNNVITMLANQELSNFQLLYLIQQLIGTGLTTISAIKEMPFIRDRLATSKPFEFSEGMTQIYSQIIN